MVVTPPSELYGPSPILHVTNTVFLPFDIACAERTNPAMLCSLCSGLCWGLSDGLYACDSRGGGLYLGSHASARALMI